MGYTAQRGPAGDQEAAHAPARSPTRRCGCSSTRGFDRVTVAEVAAAAGVSEKTVFNYFPTKEDLFFDEVPKREAALVEAIRGREPGESILGALRRLQLGECPRLCSPGFATFARIIEESTALQAKELEVMARFAQVLADGDRARARRRRARRADRRRPADQRAPAAVPRRARKQALAGKHGACGGQAAARRSRAGLRPARARARRPGRGAERGRTRVDHPSDRFARCAIGRGWS